MNVFRKKAITIYITFLSTYQIDATLFAQVTNEEFTKVLDEHSLILQISGAISPGKLPFGTNLEAAKVEASKANEYSYITERDGFYFTTTTKHAMHFNNLVIEAQKVNPDVQETFIAGA